MCNPQIVMLLNTIEGYSGLQDCRIEGIDTIANKFQHIYGVVKKKPYDILDHRKLDFDYDFEDFKRNIADLEVSFKSLKLKLAQLSAGSIS